MEDVIGVVEVKLFREVLKEGVKLAVIASRVAKGQWQLFVQNEYGIRSSWLELFPSARLAVDAGFEAIEKEGIEPFMNTKGGFEYLFDENV
jgi:translation elongation factor EF-G